MNRVFVTAAALAMGLMGPVGAWAQRDPGPPIAQDGGGKPAAKEPARPNVRLSDVIAQIARSTPGRSLDTKTESQNGAAVYRISWITNDGRRIDFVVDAQTGRILSQRGG